MSIDTLPQDSASGEQDTLDLDTVLGTRRQAVEVSTTLVSGGNEVGAFTREPREAPEPEDVDLEDPPISEASFDAASATGDLNDQMEGIDDFYANFTKILGVKGPVTGYRPTTLNIPKDFRMQFDHLNGSHAVQLALYEKQQRERHQERSRRGSAITKGSAEVGSRKPHVKAGFDPVQIIQKRAITFGKTSTARTSTIACDIHDFFRPENFHDCPDGIYEQMKPALRLATLFLTHRSCSTYWHTLWLGRRVYCEEMSRARERPCFRIAEDLPWSSERARNFSSILSSYATRIHFYFHSSPLKRRPCIASMDWITDTRDLLPLHHAHDSEPFLRGKICLHTDFYTVAKRYSLIQHNDAAAVLRYQFWLATCICHEVAHFLEWNRRSTIVNHHHEEAFWYEDTWNEAGEAWERKMFGGRVEPVASRADCQYGIATIDWPRHEHQSVPNPPSDGETKISHAQEDYKPNIYWTLPMEFVSSIQQQSTWDLLSTSSTTDGKAFHIPRIGTRSQELLGLDLTIWDDESSPGLISDELDDVNTVLKRTFDGRIIKRTRIKKRMGVLVKSKLDPENKNVVSGAKVKMKGKGKGKIKANAAGTSTSSKKTKGKKGKKSINANTNVVVDDLSASLGKSDGIMEE